MAGFKECVKCGHWHSPTVPCLSTSPIGSPQPKTKTKTKREASELGRLRQRVVELEAELAAVKDKRNTYMRSYMKARRLKRRG